MPNQADTEIALKAPLLATMPTETARALLQQAQIRKLRRGETLFIQEDPADCAFIVLRGWVKLYRTTSRGEETVIHVFTRGESFAEAVIFEGCAYPVSAEAATDCAVLALKADALTALIDRDPRLARNLVAATYRHLHRLVAEIEALKSQQGARRVAEFLLSLCDAGDAPQTVTLPYDKKLVAARLGMTPQSLSRAFAHLRERGVAMTVHGADIADLESLRRYARRAEG